MYTMLGSTLTEQAQKDLDEVEDLIEYQQQLDFYYVRFFRQTLLCHENLEIDYDLDIEKIMEYFYIGFLTCDEEVDLDSISTQKFIHPNGESFDIAHPLTKAAVIALSFEFPNTFSWSQLLESAKEILNERQSKFASSNPDELLQEIFNLYISQGIELSRVQRHFHIDVGKKPRATRLAQVYAKYKRCCIGSMHHGNITLDEMDHALIELLDGSHSIDQIQQQLAEKIKTDTALQVTLQQQGKDPVKLLNNLNSKIEQSLYFFALGGLLDQGQS